MRSLGLPIVCALVAAAGCGADATPYQVQSQMVLLDAAGTWYAGGAALPRTHILFSQTRLPAIGGDPQYADPGLTATSGCSVNRYDANAKPIPNTDLPAGAGFYAGYAKTLLASDGKAPAPGVYAAPIPDRINCDKPMLAPYYGCVFGNMNGLEKIAGASADPGAIWFPAVANSVYSSMCADCGACDLQMIPDGAGGMQAVCEQHPMLPGTVITQDLDGGGGYSALTNQALPAVGGVSSFKFVRFTVGANTVAGVDAVALDGTADVSMQWNCSPSATDLNPEVVDCPASSTGAATHLLAVYAISSTGARDSFSTGPAYSVLQCFDPIDDPRATLTISKEAIQTFLGNGTNSVLFVAGQVDIIPASSLDHVVFLTSGQAQFALISTGNAPLQDLSAGVEDLAGDDFGGTD